MKQFTFTASGNLGERLREVRSYLDGHPSSAVLAHVYAGCTDPFLIQPSLDAIYGALPEASIVGTTSAGEVQDGTVLPRSILVVVTVFETTDVTVRSFRVEPGEEERVGNEALEVVNAVEDVRAVELLADCAELASDAMLGAFDACAPDVEVFGSVPYAHTLSEPVFVFAGERQERVELVVVVYAGEQLHVASDHVIGWKPMGNSMTVTSAEGSLLRELNGKPALALYTKYLQIPNDENFYDNAFEFPFLRYINDTYMMRHPHAGLSDGSIELRAPVEVGDTMYLSYGDVPTIVSEVFEASDRMGQFHPQCIVMRNCAARKTFWDREISREIAPFQRVAATSGFFTGGEILRVNGRIVHFNTTCVVVGMREGQPDACQAPNAGGVDPHAGINVQQTSMVRRMACFINVAMQELLESNRKLEVLAKTDGLTALLNRREMSHIIESLHDDEVPFCLIMADLDDFKNVNDTYGHDVGDSVLIDAAALIRKSIEGVEGAVAGRWGGEEFMMLLPHVGIERACDVAEDLRRGIEEFHFEAVRQLTVSLGVADSQTYVDMKEIYHDVDQALYAAKAAGKNEVAIANRV